MRKEPFSVRCALHMRPRVTVEHLPTALCVTMTLYTPRCEHHWHSTLLPAETTSESVNTKAHSSSPSTDAYMPTIPTYLSCNRIHFQNSRVQLQRATTNSHVAIDHPADARQACEYRYVKINSVSCALCRICSLLIPMRRTPCCPRSASWPKTPP